MMEVYTVNCMWTQNLAEQVLQWHENIYYSHNIPNTVDAEQYS